MIRRKVKSALFIDFDNIVQILGREFADSIPRWLAWLQDGQFDEQQRKRVFATKHVYWNSQNEVHRKVFELNGFAAQSCPHRVKSKKSSADMMIAIDVIEAVYSTRAIEEFILLTTDTDFVTLIDKLGELKRQTVASANEQIPVVFTVFRDHADGVIPMYALRQAMKYERARTSFPQFLKVKPKEKSAIPAASAARALPAAPQAKAAKQQPARKPAQGKRASPAPAEDPHALLEIAGEHLAQMARSTPGLPLGRGTVIRALEKRMPAFKTSGKFGFIGCGSYAQMIERVADLRPELQLIKYKDGGMAIVSSAGSEAPA
jgi:uncharacterized LabA/DUF88 family protein